MQSLPRRLAPASFCLVALALAGCPRPAAWAPPPPAGHGYEYRFSGVYQKDAAYGSDSYRFGNMRFTSYYGAKSRNVSEVDSGPRIWTELPPPGSEADGRFNEHLGELGKKLEAK